MERLYRPNVAGMMVRQDGKLLICERSGQKGAWQFPQGGIDPGETALEAVRREIGEEVGVLPSQYESLSIAVLEAMALGVPVLVNGQCDVLKGHCTKSNGGLYYRNFFEFEGALNYLFSHPDEYQEMQENAYEYVLEHYDWDVILERFRVIIENVIEGRT